MVKIAIVGGEPAGFMVFHLIEDFPFKSLIKDSTVYSARLKFRDSEQGKNASCRKNAIFMMVVPHIGGFNPDYSGLDFCEQASKRIVNELINSSEGIYRKN